MILLVTSCFPVRIRNNLPGFRNTMISESFRKIIFLINYSKAFCFSWGWMNQLIYWISKISLVRNFLWESINWYSYNKHQGGNYGKWNWISVKVSPFLMTTILDNNWITTARRSCNCLYDHPSRVAKFPTYDYKIALLPLLDALTSGSKVRYLVQKHRLIAINRCPR